MIELTIVASDILLVLVPLGILLLVLRFSKKSIPARLCLASFLGALYVLLDLFVFKGEVDTFGTRPWEEEWVLVPGCADLCGVENLVMLLVLAILFLISFLVWFFSNLRHVDKLP